MTPQVHCLHFSGVKPCGLSSQCESSCIHFQPRGPQIALIHLGALGAVVRSTALIQPIRRKYPNCQLTWITEAPAHHLLKFHPNLERVFTLDSQNLLELSCLEFDVAFVVDKSLRASGVLKWIKARKTFGFSSNSEGVVLPLTESAEELWRIGLSDQLKFFENQKSEIQLITEALELDFQKDDYDLPLQQKEKNLRFERWWSWSGEGQSPVVGLNTGCASTLPAKKLSVENHRELIRKIQKEIPQAKIVLLGGAEETERNRAIGDGLSVFQSETQSGLRDGLISVAAVDLVITGDSLGLHMAISQKKPVVAWFGPSCAQEIELYERGEKILTQAPCSPCWKRSCHKPVMCYDLVELDEIIDATKRQLTPNQSRHSDGLSRGSASDSSSLSLD